MSQYEDVMNKKAVALRYDENKDVAPVIVASGLGYMAERIVEMANENGVPVYEDNSLATVLTQLDLGTAIPEELYQAIVDIYAYFLRYNPEKIREKKEAEEAVDKLLEDQMVLDALAEKMDVEVSQSDVFNFLASIAQQYGMDPNQFIQAIMRNGQIGSAVEEVARSKGLLAGMRAVSFTVDGEPLDLSEFLGSDEAEAEAAVDDNESVAAAAAAAAVADSLNASNEENA